MSRNQILWSFLLFFIAFLTVIAVIIGVNRFSQQKAPDGQDTSLLFGAIARSQSTGTLGYSSKLPSQAEAEQIRQAGLKAAKGQTQLSLR